MKAKEIEQVLRIQRALDAMELPVCVVLGIDYICLKHNTKDKGWYGLKVHSSIEEIRKQAATLCMPQFKCLKDMNVCMELIGQTVYWNKTLPRTVKSIMSKDEILMSEDDSLYPIDKLWIKV